MSKFKRGISELLLVIVFGLGLWPGLAQATELKCQHINLIMNHMANQHLLHNKVTSNLEHRSIDQMVKILDSAKLYFLDSDIKQIRKTMTGFVERLAKGDCKNLDEVRNIFMKRVQERADFAEKYLGKDFKFNESIEINLDSEKREYPKTDKQANEFHEKYIQWQVANFLASDMKLDEAKGQIIRRYQRALKSFKDQKKEETFASYLDAFARSLDPHSNFLSRENLEDFEIQMRLSLEGIGATLSNQDGYTVIEQLVPGGAAMTSGLLQAQDKIIAVGQGETDALEPVIDMPLKDVVRLIRGQKGTKVRLSILRKSGDTNERFAVTLTRQKINLEQEAAQINYLEKEIDGQKKTIGVLNLPSFYSDTRRGGRSCYEDTKKLLAEAAQKKVSGIVLDLSSNGGGSLEDAVKLAGLFIKTGNVVKTQGGRNLQEVLADEDPAINYAGPMVVLTSRLSASASEILAGALQDYKRAIIVGGDHTFGKGSVQSVVPLPDGLGAFKVTVGMFFIPGGNSTQHRGVAADIPLPGIFSTNDIGEHSLDYSLPPKSIKNFVSAEANTSEGGWKPVDPNLVKKLAKDSKKRVAASTDFQKVLKELKEIETQQKIVKLADIIKKKDETVAKEEKRKKEANDPKAKTEDYLKRADIQEATAVLVDYLAAGIPMRQANESKN